MNYRRQRNGQALSEAGPAMLVLLCFVVFPLLVVVYVGLGWACGWFLNQTCCRTAAMTGDLNSDGTVSLSEMQVRMKPDVDAWEESGLRAFTNAKVLDYTAVRYRRHPIRPVGPPNFVRATTTIEMDPFLHISAFPMHGFTFTYNAERPIEEMSQL